MRTVSINEYSWSETALWPGSFHFFPLHTIYDTVIPHLIVILID
jgi:hypothetical protein